MAKLSELAVVVRSKNSGPYELTCDLIFPDAATYQLVKQSGLISRELVARLYHLQPQQVVTLVEFDPALAIKFTVVRPVPAGNPGDTDVYGAQQHAPLLALEIPLPGDNEG